MANDSTAALQTLFASREVEEVIWQERIDDVAPAGAAVVDVVLTSRPAALLKQSWHVGLAYLPHGPVVKGVQLFQDGQSLVFKNVPIKRGAVLALVGEVGLLGDRPQISVSVEAAGQGAAAAAARSENPVTEISGLVTGLAVLAGVLLASYLVVKLS